MKRRRLAGPERDPERVGGLEAARRPRLGGESSLGASERDRTYPRMRWRSRGRAGRVAPRPARMISRWRSQVMPGRPSVARARRGRARRSGSGRPRDDVGAQLAARLGAGDDLAGHARACSTLSAAAPQSSGRWSIASDSARSSAITRARVGHELDEALPRVLDLERLARRLGEPLEAGIGERLEQVLLGREVAVDGADADPGVAGDLVDLGVEPAAANCRARGCEHASRGCGARRRAGCGARSCRRACSS